MAEGWVVRVAVAEDAEAAVAVLRRSITELCRADHRDDPATLEQWLGNKTPAKFREWVAHPERHLVVAAGESIGGVGMVGMGGVLYLLYVSPDAVRRGVGRALLAALETQARAWGIERLTLQAASAAEPFYEALGFRRCGPAMPGFGVTSGYPYEKCLVGSQPD